ncbi:uncharacterized protein LOC143540006 [Bidens hawaiensis]|uniref:uncharacterized protein LOC143540006 n=1 Tax=Bidens hawaiensis TaxID=980011 RepID=UPI00404A50DC
MTSIGGANAVVLILHCSVHEGNRHEILKWYEEANSSIMLPCLDDAPEHVKTDYYFSMLYKEIWFRQLFAGGSSLTAKQRLYSWFNYGDVFQIFFNQLRSATKLPYRWLWDMMDGYVNQFQSFCQYRASEIKTEQDVHLLSLRHRSLSVIDTVNLLHIMVEDSNILQILELEKDEGLQLLTETEEEDVRIESESKNVFIVMGYFSLVALLRLHCLLGNYQAGLDCLRPIDVSRQGFHPALIATQITTIYHYGFANLMLGRYIDAIREFNKFLVYIFKTNQPHQESPQILNKIEQMYALLAICLSLCPQFQLIDENVYSRLMEKYSEKLARMQRYDDESIALYRELLSYAWPTFSTPFAPNSGEPDQIYNEDGLVCHERSTSYSISFGPFASEPLVINNQLEAVIADILKLRQK